MKTYFNLKNYNKCIVTKHSNPRNRGHPPSIKEKQRTSYFVSFNRGLGSNFINLHLNC